MITMCDCKCAGQDMIDGWHDLFISEFHLTLHISISSADSISSARFHLASRILSISPTPSTGIRLASRAVRICHLVHLVHLIYAIRAHLDLGRASRPSHLPSCHLKMEIQLWVFTSLCRGFLFYDNFEGLCSMDISIWIAVRLLCNNCNNCKNNIDCMTSWMATMLLKCPVGQ